MTTMYSDRFEPRFDNLQSGVERDLTSTGKREKTRNGTIIFHGYDEALKTMFDR